MNVTTQKIINLDSHQDYFPLRGCGMSWICDFVMKILSCSPATPITPPVLHYYDPAIWTVIHPSKK